jgi:hypothetical protein
MKLTYHGKPTKLQAGDRIVLTTARNCVEFTRQGVNLKILNIPHGNTESNLYCEFSSVVYTQQLFIAQAVSMLTGMVAKLIEADGDHAIYEFKLPPASN